MANAVRGAIHQGPLGFVRKGGVDVRYFVLKENCLDYYSNQDEAMNGGERGGHLLLDDIEELDVLDCGFRIGLVGNRSMELRCSNVEELKPWVDAMTPFFDDGSEEEDEDDEIEEEVLHDLALEVDLGGKRKKKHFWLFHDRLEYTNTEEEQVAEDSFPLHTIKAVTVTSVGFEVQSGNRNLVLYCGKDDGQKWVDELSKAFKAHAKERSAKTAPRRLSREKGGKPAAPNGATSPETKAGTGTTAKPMDNAGPTESQAAPRQQQLPPQEAANQQTNGSSPAKLADRAAASPVQPPVQTYVPQLEPKENLGRASPMGDDKLPSTNAGYPMQPANPSYTYGAAKQQQPAASDVQMSSPSTIVPLSSKPPQEVATIVSSPPGTAQNGRPSLCRGNLGVIQKGREDRRYFALFEDTFEYWSSQADYERGDPPRGSVSNYSIVNLESSNTVGFIIYFESTNRLELRCNTQQEQNMWIEQWNSVLQYRITEPVNTTTKQPSIVPSASIPNFNAASSPPSFQQRTPSPQTQDWPSSSKQQTQDWPDLPGLIFMGNLMIDNKGRMKKRHFALFDNRLDYFEVASDMRAERYPRGRILLRDIRNLDFQDNGFQLVFEDAELPTMVLLADRSQLPAWQMAWSKAYQPQQDSMRGRSPNEAWDDDKPRGRSPPPSQSFVPKTRGALMEGELGLLRTHNSGRPEPRYFVLFNDRLDCFIDEAAAKRGRVLESVMKTEIQDIDVVDGGFNIISGSRIGRPLKLRALPGVLPGADDWVGAFKRAFAR